MPSNPNTPSDVLQSHDHQKLSAEQIAKAVARHAKDHKGDKTQAPKPEQKKSSKK